MKNFYTLLFASLLAFSTSNLIAQIVPCTLTGGSVYIDHTTSPWMMNATVNGMSMYNYSWADTNGLVISTANQTPFYTQWCVTITDNITGCDTIICQDCVADTAASCVCNMMWMPVCGCDGIQYANSCVADCADVPWTPAVPNGQLGGWLPCVTPTPSWDCINGACIDPGTGLGAYTSLGACNVACVAVTPSWDCSAFGCYDPGTGQGAFSDYFICDSICALGVPTWDCINGACVDPGTGMGQYATQANCQTMCMLPPPTWDCTTGGCIDPGTGLGQFATQANCQSMCINIAPSWDCINGTCIDPGTGLGAYNSLGVCNSACAITPSWDCITGQGCIDPGTGQGSYNSLVACNSVCATTPSWDCDGMGTCTDPGTGAGMYASQAACDNACIVSGVEEQTTNKTLLKITDLLGRETKGSKNDVLFYIYDDGTVEKRIVIE